MGYDGPDGADEPQYLSSRYMRYTNILRSNGEGLEQGDRIFIQRVAVNDGEVFTSPQKYPAVNCYDDGHVCWGENNPAKICNKCSLPILTVIPMKILLPPDLT